MQTVISSASNDTVKRMRKLLGSAKARREAGQYIAEGIHLTRSYLAAGRTPLFYAYAESAEGNQEVKQLIEQLKASGAQAICLADSLFESLTSIHASVGLLILCAAETSRMAGPLDRSAVLLEDIQDPGNIGTILRTAAAVGIKDIALSESCASPWSPKALRAGMGAQFNLRIYENADLPSLAEEATVPVMATTLEGETTPLYQLDLSRPAVWVFGNEGQGISPSLARQATTAVWIPQAGSASIESLNVAAAATVCLYEQYRQQIGA